MRIRAVQEGDLQALFEIQKDPEARWMAAFGSKDFDDKEAYLRHMFKIANDKDVIYKVIEHEGQVVGNVGKWISEHGPELSYWTDKKFRGIGLTSSAVKEFLLLFAERPLYAHTAGDNLASQAILSKLGFSKYQEFISYSEIRGEEILEIGFVLE